MLSVAAIDMRDRFPLLAGLAAALSALCGCGPSEPAGPVEIAYVGSAASLFDQGVRLSPGAQDLRAASAEGLVKFDAAGQIVPGVAERWIVTDDGLSYIFRLQERTWPDGEPISAAQVRRSLNDVLSKLEGTSLGLDLAKLTEVRAMTDRIVELRLSSPMPQFLRLLAQPELGIRKSGTGTGPMTLERDAQRSVARLTIAKPDDQGARRAAQRDEDGRELAVRAMDAERAIAAFSRSEVDLVVQGRLATFPQIDLGPLSRGAVQVDPAIGLMGLKVRSAEGVLADPARREALSMALDRTALIAPFGLGGWQPSSWIVPPAMFQNTSLPAGRWDALSIEDRRNVAAARIARWRQESASEQSNSEQSADDAIEITVGLPPGPGSDLLFQGIAQSWATIGIRAVQVPLGAGAQLEWIDRVARYSSPRWFLNQFNCEVTKGPCSPQADDLVLTSIFITDLAQKEEALAQAHAVLVAEDVFIPLGAPVRWSLVRGAIDAFEPNPWGVHPLFPLTGTTI